MKKSIGKFVLFLSMALLATACGSDEHKEDGHDHDHDEHEEEHEIGLRSGANALHCFANGFMGPLWVHCRLRVCESSNGFVERRRPLARRCKVPIKHLLRGVTT